MSVRYEIENVGSYAKRTETAGGDAEGELLRRIFPPELPKGYKFAYRWLDRMKVEYGVVADTQPTVPAVPGKAAPVAPLSPKATAATLTAAKLSERATELGVDTKGKTKEQLIAAVDEMEQLELATK
jgi:hypothetical protein